MNAAKEELDKEIDQELYHSEDVYKTENLDGKEYFKCDIIRTEGFNRQHKDTFYIPASKMRSKDEFHPIDRVGNEFDEIICCFDGQGTCSISDQSIYHRNDEEFTPQILFHKDDRKRGVNERLIDSLQQAVLELRYQIEAIKKQIEAKLSQLKKELETPFVSKAIRNIALESVDKQLRDMKVRLEDCKRLEDLIHPGVAREAKRATEKPGKPRESTQNDRAYQGRQRPSISSQ